MLITLFGLMAKAREKAREKARGEQAVRAAFEKSTGHAMGILGLSETRRGDNISLWSQGLNADGAGIISIHAVGEPYDDEVQRKTAGRIVDELGFSFASPPTAVGQRKGYVGKPVSGQYDLPFGLPEGWSSRLVSWQKSWTGIRIHDEKGRFRAWYDDARRHLTFYPRIQLGKEIIARTYIQTDRSSALINIHRAPVLSILGSCSNSEGDYSRRSPFFAYIEPSNDEVSGFFNVRCARADYKRVEGATRFVSGAVQQTFPGAYVTCGLKEFVLAREGGLALTDSVPRYGSIFDHWNDGVEDEVEKLCTSLCPEIAKVIGEDNSFLRGILPTPAEVTKMSESPTPFKSPQGSQKVRILLGLNR
jgi:hypothetical protein